MKMTTGTINTKPKNFSKPADTVGDIIADRIPLIFSPGDTIEHIVKQMHRHDKGAVGITDGKERLIGLLTEKDILKTMFGTFGETKDACRSRRDDMARRGRDLTARDVLVSTHTCLFGDMPIEAAMEIIRTCDDHYLPVVSRNAERRLKGIVSERELFWHVQDKTRREMTQKNTLLSYFMHHEPYGLGTVEKPAV